LDQWWEREIAWSKNRDLVLRKAKTRFEELLKRAKDGSWEIQQ